jgi:hypothetical protein
MDMPDEFLRSAAIGVVGTLLGFEMVAAVRSLIAARPMRSAGHPAMSVARVEHQPILMTQAFAIREHFAERRQATNALRAQFGVLRSSRHGRQLRMAIGRVQPGPVAVHRHMASLAARGQRFG